MLRPTSHTATESALPSGVVDDLLDETTNVAVALSEVEGAELGRGDTVVRVRTEDSAALTLVADD